MIYLKLSFKTHSHVSKVDVFSNNHYMIKHMKYIKLSDILKALESVNLQRTNLKALTINETYNVCLVEWGDCSMNMYFILSFGELWQINVQAIKQFGWLSTSSDLINSFISRKLNLSCILSVKVLTLLFLCKLNFSLKFYL